MGRGGTRPVAWLVWTLVMPAGACAQEPPPDPAVEEIRESTPVIGLPCEGCEGVFEGMPAEPGPVARIAPADEAGEPLRIEGTVYDPEGRPAHGVIVYAYHTDAEGVYPPAPDAEGWAARHGRLRGWARTDERGRYRFDTIRPAGYPGRDAPQHVHMHVVEVGCCTYWIDSIHFLDDPRLGRDEREQEGARGGSGLVRPVRDQDGVWRVTRDIHLGRNVPGHPGSDAGDEGGPAGAASGERD